MFWRISDLPPVVREELAGISRARRFDSSVPCFFRWDDRPSVLVRCFLAGSLLAFLVGGIAFSAAQSAFSEEKRHGAAVAVAFAAALLPASWGMIALLELIRGRSSGIKPFLLVTPKVLVQTDYVHGCLKALRLSDATGFEAAETYQGSNQAYGGRQYTFRFPHTTIQCTLTRAQDITLLESVLQLAKNGGETTTTGDVGLGLVPPYPGAVKPLGFREVTKPTGLFWLGLAGILLTLVLLLAVASRVFK